MTESLLEVSLAAHQRGDFDSAERGYRKLVSAADADSRAARRLLGVLLLQQGRDGEAVIELDAALASEPTDVEIRTNLAVGLRRSGALEAAEKHARLAVESAPERPASWNALGLSLLDSGKFSEAAALFEEALTRHPAALAFRVHLGQAQLGARDLAAAETAFRAALGVSQDIPEAWRGLGRVHAKRAQHAEAIGAYQRAAALMGPDAELAVEFGAALCAAGLHAQGQALLRGAVEQQPDNAEAWYALGRALLAQDRTTDAAEALSRAAALAPDDPVIQHLLRAALGEAPEQVDSSYVRTLYEDFADRFEATLVDSLGYSVPADLARMLVEHSGLRQARTLDLGCGTGLMAAALADIGGHIEGVDLSPRMLQLAAGKQIYAALHEAEIVEFLRGQSPEWDLIIAADVVIYVGQLAPLFQAAFAALRPGGWLALSAEAAREKDIELDPATARHRHGGAYLERSLGEVGFRSVRLQDTGIRRERGLETAGYLVLAQRPAD